MNLIIFPDKSNMYELDLKDKLREILKLYGLCTLISIIILLFTKLITDIDNQGISLFNESHSIIYIILIGGLLVPLFEEATFRLSLIFKPIYISISFSFFILLTLADFYNVGLIEIDRSLPFRILISIIIGLITYLISSRYSRYLKTFWTINFKWIYILAAVVFGVFHTQNFPITYKTIFLIPLLTLPNIIYGLFFGYTRIKYGFLYGFIFHSLTNLIALTIALTL